MGFFFGGGASSVKQPEISGIKVQEKGYGNVIKIVYGITRVTPILGWTNGFKKEKVKSGGGKGGGKNGGAQYRYYADIILFLCEGPGIEYRRMWRDKNYYDNPSTVTNQFSAVYHGDYTQTAWGYITTKYPDQALAYRGIAYVGEEHYHLRDGAVLGNHSFEVRGRLRSNTSGDQNIFDVHIKDVINDFLHNENYGVLDQNTDAIPLEMGHMHDYCRARGLLIAHELATQKAAHEYIKEWATVANAGVVWSEGKLKFLPYADLFYSNDYGSYTPDNTIQAAFDDSNIVEILRPERKKAQDCYNSVTIECRNRNKAYSAHPVEVKDEYDIQVNGLRPAGKVKMESINLPSIALIVAYTELSKGGNIRNTYTIRTGPEYDRLEPMDFITITDEGLGLNAVRCRIVSVSDEEPTGSGNGTITIKAEQAAYGVYCG